jgi:MFS family permease
MASDARTGRYRDAFASGEFRVVFGSYLVSMLGSVVAAVALTVLVYERSGSSLLAALTFTLAFLPHLVGGALLSSLADDMPPRRLLVLCDAIAAVFVLAMAIPGLPLAVPLLLLVVTNLLSPVRGGTRSALLPDILPPEAFVPARSLLRLVAQGSQLAGNAAAAALLLVLTPRQVLLIDAASFAASAAVLGLGLQARPARALTRTTGLARDSLAAARTAFRLPELRAVLLFSWLVPAFSVWPEALSAPGVASHGAPASAVGWWLMAIPAGTAIGEVAALWWLSPERRLRLLRVLAAAGFVPFLLFAFQPALLPSLALLVVAGLGSAYIPGADALLLEETPEELRGRVFTISTAGLMTTQGLGFAASGAVAELLPVNATIVLSGLAGLAVVACIRPRRAPRTAPAGVAASA